MAPPSPQNRLERTISQNTGETPINTKPRPVEAKPKTNVARRRPSRSA